MRKLGAAAALVAVFLAAGCGTMANLLDLEGRGREPYGGIARDRKLLDEPTPALNPTGLHAGASGKAAIALLVLYPAVLLVGAGLVATELSLTLVGDTCTCPLVPVLNQVDAALAMPGIVPESLRSRGSDCLLEPGWLLDRRRPDWTIQKTPLPVKTTASDSALPKAQDAELDTIDDLPPLPTPEPMPSP